MFYRYEIKNNGNEDILYLYLTMTYEFSKELEGTETNNTIENKTKEFIKNNSIDFSGDKIYLIVDGIIIKALNINKDFKIKEIRDGNQYSNKNFIIKLRIGNTMKDITLKDYLLGVLATNTIKNIELSTLKALTLVYRTYAYKEMKKNNYVSAYNEFQVYKPISYYKIIWAEKYQEIYNRLLKAITDTDGEFLTYDDNCIESLTHICSNGKTTSSSYYPYLESIDSVWDYAYPNYINIQDYSFQELEQKLDINKNDFEKIKITLMKDSTLLKEIEVNNKKISSSILVTKLGLKSFDITIIVNPTYVRFITKGCGNNLGISQFGANEIAKAGCSYKSIIKYYFPKVTINKNS